MTQSAIEEKIRSTLPITRWITAYMPVKLMQWIIEKTVSRAKMPDGVTQQPVTANGIPCHWIIPQNSPQDKVLLYLHGGGFIFGVTSIHLEMLAYLANKMGIRALMVDYRLAPQHPFPAALEDCISAYQWLRTQGYPAENIVIAGDSAGGNLTLTTLMALRDDGDALPAAAACLSPVADLSNKEAGFKEGFDAILHPKAAKFMNKSYVADNDATNPLLSPIYGDWHGLPPLLIHAGEEEILREDAIQAEKLAKEAGVDVTLEIYPRMWHVWQISPELPQAKQSLDDIAAFLKAHLKA